jgi:hypothetical protein
MGSLAFPLAVLNAMVMVVSLFALYAPGVNSKDAWKVFIVEGTMSLSFFCVIVLAFERLSMAAFDHVVKMSESSAKKREFLCKFVAEQIGEGVVFKVGDSLVVSSKVFSETVVSTKTSVSEINEALTPLCTLTPGELVPVCDASSQISTLTEDGKDSSNEDALSAATTM